MLFRSQQIEETIWKYVGVRMTPHQFRHLAAKIMADHDPGNFEATRRLLGHKNHRTTVNFYSGFQTQAAGEHYQKIVHGELEAGRGARKVQRKPVGRGERKR